MTTTTTTVTQAPQKREVAVQDTPAALADFAPSAVSAACSLQATPVTEATTMFTTTTATVSSGTVETTTTLPVRTTIVTSVVAAAPSCTARGVNLVNNGGFEYGMAAWSQSISPAYGSVSPDSYGVVSGGSSGGYSYRVVNGNQQAGMILQQEITGLTKGVSYTMSYKYSVTSSAASSINCAISTWGSTSSITSDGRVEQWLSGPTGNTRSFVAQWTSATLRCSLVSSKAQTFRIDEFYIGC